MNNKVLVEYTGDKDILRVHQYKSETSTICEQESTDMITDELKYWDMNNCFACQICFQNSDSPNPSKMHV